MADYNTKIILSYINGIIHRISSDYLQEQIIQYGIISFMHKPVCNLVLIFKDNAIYDFVHNTLYNNSESVYLHCLIHEFSVDVSAEQSVTNLGN